MQIRVAGVLCVRMVDDFLDGQCGTGLLTPPNATGSAAAEIALSREMTDDLESA